jgi:hypothetical protein
VLVLGSVAVLPIAMSGTFAGEQLALELAIWLAGIALVFAVLLRYGLLSLVVMFHTFMLIEIFRPTTDFSRPYAGAAAVLLAGSPGFRYSASTPRGATSRCSGAHCSTNPPTSSVPPGTWLAVLLGRRSNTNEACH